MRTVSQYGKQVSRAFGQALRAARTLPGVSQERLGGLCDLDRTYPSLLECGLRGPTLAMMARLPDQSLQRKENDDIERLQELMRGEDLDN